MLKLLPGKNNVQWKMHIEYMMKKLYKRQNVFLLKEQEKLKSKLEKLKQNTINLIIIYY